MLLALCIYGFHVCRFHQLQISRTECTLSLYRRDLAIVDFSFAGEGGGPGTNPLQIARDDVS